MKILTLNTHSLLEEDYEYKLKCFTEGVLREMPALIALQEVNQSMDAPAADPAMLKGQYPRPDYVTIRRDNHVQQIVLELEKAGVSCSWCWIPIKIGYGRFEEGVAMIALNRKIVEFDSFPVSRVNDYQNFRTRKVLGVRIEGVRGWFYSVHMGWWNDPVEPFLQQWKVLNSCVAAKRICDPVWLMGDFNAPTCYRGESYDTIRSTGWLDTYTMARQKDDGITVPGVIDGWRARPGNKHINGMRLDYIWCSEEREILSSRVMFSGETEEVVSDHFAVMIEVKE